MAKTPSLKASRRPVSFSGCGPAMSSGTALHPPAQGNEGNIARPKIEAEEWPE
jgi:hypothetical protein